MEKWSARLWVKGFNVCVRTRFSESGETDLLDSSREAAQDCSPGRKPWEKPPSCQQMTPRQGASFKLPDEKA